MRGLIGWALLMATVLMALRRPRIALYGLVACDYARPQSGTDGRVLYGFENVKISLVLNVVALLMLAVGTQKYRLRWERFHGGVLALYLAVLSSAVFAFKPELASNRVYDYTLTLLQYVFICAFIRDLADLRGLYWAIGLSVALVSTRYCYGKFRLGEYGWEGPTGDRNELAMIIVMAMPFLFVLALTAKKKALRLLALGSIAPCALVIVFSLSRGGFLGLAAVALYILFRLHHKKWLIALAIVGVLAGLSMVPPEFYERIGTVKTAHTQDASSRGRINAWYAAVAMAKDRPLTGVGVGNFLVRFGRYAPDPKDVHVAHSSFFQILGDTGVPGALTWVYLVVALWIMAAKAERRVKRLDRGAWTDERYYIFAVKASWIGYVICGAFLSQEDFDFFYHLLGITSRLLVFGVVRAAVVPVPSVRAPQMNASLLPAVRR
jgi:probable O-glycosylation ligase (exosortase A-associated)